MSEAEQLGAGMLGGGERSPERINAEQWNSALLSRNGHFLQSWEWGAFQQRFGRRVTFLAMSEDTFAWDLSSRNAHADQDAQWHDLDLQATVIEHELPLGLSYFYIPRGPVLSGNIEVTHEQLFSRFHQHITDLAKSRGTAMIRIEPAFGKSVVTHATDHLIRMGFRHKEATIQPRKNLILDLTVPEMVLRRHMHKKTRYNIKLADRHGVSVAHEPSSEAIEVLTSLIAETAKRQRISAHSKRYYQLMSEAIPELTNEDDLLKVQLHHRIYVARHEEKPLAAALVMYFGNRATYLHGGTSLKNRNVMAPYALHWKIMQDAKAMGYTKYDFGGVDEDRWPGITRFKKGFAGWVEEFPGLYEMPLSRTKYGLYRMLKKLRR